MTKGSLLKTAFGAALAATIGLATPAYALEGKQCLPMAEMNAALHAEGQRTMIIGDREALQNPTGKIKDASINRYLNAVTSNADGSVGYQIEGDLPRAQTSTNVCVAAKLTNVRFYDARVNMVPAAAYLGGQFDAVVKENAGKGNRPMMIADTVHSDGRGSDRRGLPLVMFGNVVSKTAFLATQLSDGRPQFLVGLADTEYTQAGLATLNPQIALNTR